jgi:hypothetical protein
MYDRGVIFIVESSACIDGRGIMYHPEIENFKMLLGRIIKQQFSHNFKIWPTFIFFTGNLA